MARPLVVFHVTGFGSFPGVPENPTSWIVQRLPEALRVSLATQNASSDDDSRCHAVPFDRPGSVYVKGAPLAVEECRILEVSGVAVCQALMDMYSNMLRIRRKNTINVFLHFGVDAQQGCFYCLERTGKNIATFLPRGDMRGWEPLAQVIYPGEDAEIVNKLDINRLAEKMNMLCRNRTGSDCVVTDDSYISDDAGAYLCNWIYYSSLRMTRQQPDEYSLFVHIPPFKAIPAEQQLEMACDLLQSMAEVVLEKS